MLSSLLSVVYWVGSDLATFYHLDTEYQNLHTQASKLFSLHPRYFWNSVIVDVCTCDSVLDDARYKVDPLCSEKKICFGIFSLVLKFLSK